MFHASRSLDRPARCFDSNSPMFWRDARPFVARSGGKRLGDLRAQSSKSSPSACGVHVEVPQQHGCSTATPIHSRGRAPDRGSAAETAGCRPNAPCRAGTARPSGAGSGRFDFCGGIGRGHLRKRAGRTPRNGLRLRGIYSLSAALGAGEHAQVPPDDECVPEVTAAERPLDSMRNCERNTSATTATMQANLTSDAWHRAVDHALHQWFGLAAPRSNRRES